MAQRSVLGGLRDGAGPERALFRQQLPVSPRLTVAALQGDVSDAAHVGRMFRQTVGLTPSHVLKPFRQVTLQT